MASSDCYCPAPRGAVFSLSHWDRCANQMENSLLGLCGYTGLIRQEVRNEGSTKKFSRIIHSFTLKLWRKILGYAGENEKHTPTLLLWKIFQTILKCSLLEWGTAGGGGGRGTAQVTDRHSKANIFIQFIKALNPRETGNKHIGWVKPEFSWLLRIKTKII